MRAGIPQLIAPVFFDQSDNTSRIEALGVGRRVMATNQGELEEGLLDVLRSQPLRENCVAIRDRFAGRDPNRKICGLIEAAI